MIDDEGCTMLGFLLTSSRIGFFECSWKHR